MGGRDARIGEHGRGLELLNQAAADVGNVAAAAAARQSGRDGLGHDGRLQSAQSVEDSVQALLVHRLDSSRATQGH